MVDKEKIVCFSGYRPEKFDFSLDSSSDNYVGCKPYQSIDHIQHRRGLHGVFCAGNWYALSHILNIGRGGVRNGECGMLIWKRMRIK